MLSYPGYEKYPTQVPDSLVGQSQGAKPTLGPGGLLVGLLEVGLLDVGLLEDAAGVNLHLPILFSFQTCSPLLPGNVAIIPNIVLTLLGRIKV